MTSKNLSNSEGLQYTNHNIRKQICEWTGQTLPSIESSVERDKASTIGQSQVGVVVIKEINKSHILKREVKWIIIAKVDFSEEVMLLDPSSSSLQTKQLKWPLKD